MAEYREFHCPYGDDFEGGDECDRCEQYELCMETYPPLNLIEIPKGATNGDIIKAMFPNSETYFYEKYGLRDDHYSIIIGEDVVECNICCDVDWWNAPYTEKRGNENEHTNC